MSSIREEMRIGEKLAPKIVGPTLEAATQILEKAYSQQTRLEQGVRETLARCNGFMSSIVTPLPLSLSVSLFFSNQRHSSTLSLKPTVTADCCIVPYTVAEGKHDVQLEVDF